MMDNSVSRVSCGPVRVVMACFYKMPLSGNYVLNCQLMEAAGRLGQWCKVSLWWGRERSK